MRDPSLEQQLLKDAWQNDDKRLQTLHTLFNLRNPKVIDPVNPKIGI